MIAISKSSNSCTRVPIIRSARTQRRLFLNAANRQYFHLHAFHFINKVLSSALTLDLAHERCIRVCAIYAFGRVWTRPAHVEVNEPHAGGGGCVRSKEKYSGS